MTEQLPLKASAEAMPVAAQADPMLAIIERVMLDPSLPMERITSLMDIRERQMNKEAEQAFNAAFASAMAEMPDVPKTGLNQHTSNKYSTLDDLIRTTRPVLARHGLSLNWTQGEEGNRITIKAIVRHALGHQITSQQSGQRDNGKAMNDLQGGGSTETYLKRYTGFAILGLSSGDEVDDDGRSAGAGRITEEQFITLRSGLDETGGDEAKFLRYFKVDMLEELPMSRYGEAEAMISRKRKAPANA